MIFFSKNLKLLREKKGIRQVDIAELINVKPNTISNYEKGTTEPDFKSLKTMIELFKVSADDMLYSDLSSINAIEITSNTNVVTQNDMSIFLKLMSDKDIKVESQAKEIGRLETTVEQLRSEIKKRNELDVLNAAISSIANVG